MKRFNLKAAQEGIAVSKAFCIRKTDAGKDTADPPEKDASLLFKNAISSLRSDLSGAAGKADKENTKMIEAQIMLLDDPGFAAAAADLIKDEGYDPVSAVKTAGKELEERFSSNDNPYIKGRAADIRGLTEELIARLTGTGREEIKENVILVGDEISPAFFLQLDRSLISGIVTAKGSGTSHLAVLAGNYGIPYVYGSIEAVTEINDGDMLVIDGEELSVGPDEETVRIALKKKEEQSVLKSAHGEASVRTRTRILANAGSIEDIEAAVTAGAEGVGLLRTEFLFLERDSEPSEDEQYEVYSKAAKIMGDRELTIRTMDIGADKKVSWLSMSDEINPALGCRGIRVSLRFKDVFKRQVRAMLRAGVSGNIGIMLPMITSVGELDEACLLIRECAEELEKEGIPFRMPKTGVMIETPSAVMMAPELAEKADFFSIGTNDLMQYTMALDRESADTGRYEESGLEPVLRLVSLTVKAAHEKNIPVCVCGELAGNDKALSGLIDAGVDRLSVSVSKIKKTRTMAYEAENEALKKLRTGMTDIASPSDGEIFPMEEIPDPAFSSGSLGKCIGILPKNGSVYAPCDGVITSIAETKHAVTIENTEGETILIHVGIDTVSLKGKGFELKAAVGDNVSAGQLLLEADIEMIKNAGLSPMIIVAKN